MILICNDSVGIINHVILPFGIRLFTRVKMYFCKRKYSIFIIMALTYKQI